MSYDPGMAKVRRYRSKLAGRRAPKTALVTFRLMEQDRAVLDRMAKEMGVPLSDVLRKCLVLVAAAYDRHGDKIKRVTEELAEVMVDTIREAAEAHREEVTQRR